MEKESFKKKSSKDVIRDLKLTELTPLSGDPLVQVASLVNAAKKHHPAVKEAFTSVVQDKEKVVIGINSSLPADVAAGYLKILISSAKDEEKVSISIDNFKVIEKEGNLVFKKRRLSK